MDGERSSTALLDFLGERGVPSTLRNLQGHAPLHKAALHGATQAVDWLLDDSRGTVTREEVSPDRTRMSPSALAAASGHTVLATRLRHIEDVLWHTPVLWQPPAGGDEIAGKLKLTQPPAVGDEIISKHNRERARACALESESAAAATDKSSKREAQKNDRDE